MTTILDLAGIWCLICPVVFLINAAVLFTLFGGRRQ